MKLAVSVEVLTLEDDVWCDDHALSHAVRVWFTTSTNGQTTLRSKVICGGP